MTSKRTDDTSAHDSGQCPVCERNRIGFLKDCVANALTVVPNGMT